MDLNIIYIILGILFICSVVTFLVIKKKSIKFISVIGVCLVLIVTCLVS